MIIGGKHSYLEAPTNSVEVFPLHMYKDTSATWEAKAPMIEARMCFSAVVLDKKDVYVFGGIKGSQSGADKHIPVMVSNPIEKYNLATNIWEQIVIANAPVLASFAWGVSMIDE
jgi:N-acetylneuraminic acid mutarotase